MKSKLTRAVFWSLAVLVAVPALAFGAGEGRHLILGERNPHGGSLGSETEIIARNGTYSTRQSNLGSGGGAIYGCRAAVGAEPCVRANNLRAGRAFEFESQGKEGGRISLKDATGVPFTTNATGKVENLNADRLDDKTADDFAATGDLLFAAVTPTGALGAKRGATTASLPDAAANTYAVKFERDVDTCSFTVSPIAAAAGAAAAPLVVQPNAADKTQVLVDQPDDPADPVPFYLQVIC